MSTTEASDRHSGVDPGRDERCLVVGYDRGSSARAAVAWAARSLPARGRLIVVYACKPMHAPSLESAGERRRLAGAAIDELMLDEDALLDCDLQTEISELDPVRALSDAALRHGAEAIVLGAQEHSRLHEAIGTVTSELLKHAPVAVTVVPDP
jgi:nucleotide-binding universal stress UspA family protein